MKFTHALVAITAVVALTGTAACEDLDSGTAADRTDTKNAAKADAKSVDSSAKPGKDKSKPAAPKETGAQSQARGTAADYLDTMAFSRSGLINQLVQFEGFKKADAIYGVDAQHANWNEQAALSAKEYFDSGQHFSRDGMINQLVQFEGFTKAQATYAVNKVGL
jgi:hypothetical protein